MDLDNDGWQDVLFVNGHVQDNHQINPDEGLSQRLQLFLNDGSA